jgi:hypothetical protein
MSERKKEGCGGSNIPALLEGTEENHGTPQTG